MKIFIFWSITTKYLLNEKNTSMYLTLSFISRRIFTWTYHFYHFPNIHTKGWNHAKPPKWPESYPEPHILWKTTPPPPPSPRRDNKMASTTKKALKSDNSPKDDINIKHISAVFISHTTNAPTLYACKRVCHIWIYQICMKRDLRWKLNKNFIRLFFRKNIKIYKFIPIKNFLELIQDGQ